MNSSQAPRVLGGRYEIGELLGSGGMGEVYAGHDLRLDRPVAIKVMRSPTAPSQLVRDRFEREARMAARLIHPNVVAVFDSGDSDGSLFLVMERLPGRTLADVIAEGPLGVDEVQTLGAEVLAALGAAHGAGMVHRDVKPANILSTSGGLGTGHWKVSDFGIAKSEPADDATATGLVYGTLAYLAPERIAGRPATVATDLYAVGVVLYEALSGQRPVPIGAPPSEYLAPHPPPLPSLRPGLPPALTSAIERAMAIDPSARFATAAAMAGALSVGAADTMRGRDDTAPIQTSETETRLIAMEPRPMVREPRRWPGRPFWFRAGLAAGAVVIALVAVLATRHEGSTAGSGSATPFVTTPAAAVTLPPSLEASLQHLEQAVRP
ncbi:MAG: serine/threonine-protein kinase [Acidimicrobiales bacterium]